MTDHKEPAAVAPCKHPGCNCAWVAGQGLVCEAAPKASAVPDLSMLAPLKLVIDQEGSNLVAVCVPEDGEFYRISEVKALLAAAPQAEEAPAAPNAQIKHLTHERDLARRAATEACARAEKAEAQLAAIRAGVEVLQRYGTDVGSFQPLEDGGYIDRDDVLALFPRLPAPACDICAGTKTAFGKRCECVKGASV